jgi:hypothetical protein
MSLSWLKYGALDDASTASPSFSSMIHTTWVYVAVRCCPHGALVGMRDDADAPLPVTQSASNSTLTTAIRIIWRNGTTLLDRRQSKRSLSIDVNRCCTGRPSSVTPVR